MIYNVIVGIASLIAFIAAIIMWRIAGKRIKKCIELQEKIDKSLEKMERINDKV